MRELLSSYDFPGNDIPIVRGSALRRWKPRPAEPDPTGSEAGGGVDRYIPTPVREIDKPS